VLLPLKKVIHPHHYYSKARELLQEREKDSALDTSYCARRRTHSFAARTHIIVATSLRPNNFHGSTFMVLAHSSEM
jgi:hypothetical protein